jgi:hypothetical protein
MMRAARCTQPAPFMNDTSPATQSNRRGRSWAKWVWLFLFVAFIVVVALAPWLAPRDDRPFVVLRNGIQLTFLGLTEPTTPSSAPTPAPSTSKPAAPSSTAMRPPFSIGTISLGSVSYTRAFHVRPDGPQPTWWKQAYKDAWIASPAWLQKWFPAPPMSRAVDYHALVGWGRSVPKYCFWIHASDPSFSIRDWSAFINGFSCSWGSYQGNNTSVPTHAGLATVPSTEDPVWWLDCHSIPSDWKTIELRFVSKLDTEEAAIEFDNPFYKPATE